MPVFGSRIDIMNVSITLEALEVRIDGSGKEKYP